MFTTNTASTASFLPTYRANKLFTLNVDETENCKKYSCTFLDKMGRVFEVKILPLYRQGTASILRSSGSARIEICEKRTNDWVLYRLVYTNVVNSRFDLSGDIAAEFQRALAQINVIDRFSSINIDFVENGVKRCLAA